MPSSRINRTTTTCRTLTLAALSALLLIAAIPTHAQTETVVYNFTGGSDGANPLVGLTSDGAGNFYGTTYYGGLGNGTVFELSPSGNGGWNETVLYSFTGAADGRGPSYSRLRFDGVGNIYGTTEGGGANYSGVVFELSPVGANWTETVLYNFCSQGGYDCTDGFQPESGLIMDPAGNLYGTTEFGGPHNNGVVFELSPSEGGWTYQVIYDVGYIAGLTMDAAGNLFGVGYDTAFELSPNGNGGWNSTVIHTFCAGTKDGCDAEGTLVLDQRGRLYGTTREGGAQNCGTVYKLKWNPKKGKWTETILHSFKIRKDGSQPDGGGIVFDAAGNIYGNTLYGGEFGYGTVYELVLQVGKGSYREKVLWSFDNTDGSGTDGNLILDSSGNLYGTAFNGGSSNAGVVFEVTP